ncbi:hypothetical protein [Roseovarius sp. EL26]|uniref:hypothetical protein n=1 Tax=Roseovarius sp. EL26 TaxID=2126672 RepID=UPI000EA0A1A5|nr:hypothetical protein [Roseovarius sp. EL26]
MSVTNILGFAVVAGIVVAGVDYHQQSKTAGLALGQLSPGAYFATYKERFVGAQEEKRLQAEAEERAKRWRIGGRPYLPEAPEGWTRNALSEGDNSAVLPQADESNSDKASGSMVANMEVRAEADRIKELDGRSWVYKRGNEAVYVEVRTRQEANANSLIGLVADTINGMSAGSSQEGYAVAGGVAFAEQVDWQGNREHHYRVLKGIVGFGQEIELRVHANASRNTTREILQAIDYDGLNAMLPYPMKTVGNDAALPEGIPEAELAEKMVDLRNEFLGLKAQEAQYRMANIDSGALIVNTYLQGYTGVDGAIDLTAGQKVNMKTLINLGYRKGLNALLEGRSSKDASDEIEAMIQYAMAQIPDETSDTEDNVPEAQQMSPELAKELGLYQENASDNQSSDYSNIKSSGFTKAEIAYVHDNADIAKFYNDAGDQTVARVMEYRRGLPPGDCVVDHTASKVACRENAQAVREARKTGSSEGAASGGLGKLWGAVSSAFSGDGADEPEETAAIAKPKGEKPKRIQLSGGSSCLEGSASKFCKN